MNENKTNGFPTKIFIGLLLLSGIGGYFLLNIQGLFYVPVSEYFGVARSTFSLYYTAQCAGAFIGASFAGTIISKYKRQMPILIFMAAVVQFMGYFLFSKAQSVSVFFIVAPFLGIAGAFDTQMIMGLVLANWFNKKNGLILGIVTAFSSLFGAL
ncbi:MAG: MFS transporter, partial [Clostridiales bacterium]|nr:MFS transporter [Clostridiales bacterium]